MRTLRPLVVAAALIAAVALAVPASAATAVYEAENAALSGGAAVATDHPGYAGSGFVAGYTDANKGKARTSFAVTPGAAGRQTLALRYANGTGSAQTLSLYVNGSRVQQVALAATANWDSWTTAATTASLTAGANTVAYAFDTTDSGNVNLDDLAVTPVAATPAGTLEAESASLTGGTRVETDHAGYTGTGFVGGYTDGHKGAAATTFALTAATAGSAPLTLRYANGLGSARDPVGLRQRRRAPAAVAARHRELGHLGNPDRHRRAGRGGQHRGGQVRRRRHRQRQRGQPDRRGRHPADRPRRPRTARSSRPRPASSRPGPRSAPPSPGTPGAAT